MNILFLTPRNSKKNLGGVEGHVRILTRELVKRGHNIKEIALDESIKVTPCSARSHLFKLQAWGYLWGKRDLFRWAEVIHVHDVFWWLLPYVLLNRLGLICGSFNLLNKVAERDTNDTNRHPNDTNKKSVFVTFHGWEGVCPPSRSAVWQKRVAAFLSNGTIGVGNFFKKWYGVKADKVVWGVNTIINKGQAFRLAKGRALRQIVFLGRLEEVNGVEVVVEALEKLKKIEKKKDGEKRGKRKSEFIFIGDGSYRKQAEKFGKVTGMVKNPQKYLVDADVVITSSYMSMLEVAAIGKPIIAVANNELKMDYLNCHPLRKYIMVARNADELYKGLTLVYQGETLKDLEVAQRWANKQTPQRLADIYEGLWNLR